MTHIRPRSSKVIDTGWRTIGSAATSLTSKPSATFMRLTASSGESVWAVATSARSRAARSAVRRVVMAGASAGRRADDGMVSPRAAGQARRAGKCSSCSTCRAACLGKNSVFLVRFEATVGHIPLDESRQCFAPMGKCWVASAWSDPCSRRPSRPRMPRGRTIRTIPFSKSPAARIPARMPG